MLCTTVKSSLFLLSSTVYFPLLPPIIAFSCRYLELSARLLTIFSQSFISLEDPNTHFLECHQGLASTSNAAVAAAVLTVDSAITHQRPPQAHQAAQTHSLARRLKPKQSAEIGHT